MAWAGLVAVKTGTWEASRPVLDLELIELPDGWEVVNGG